MAILGIVQIPLGLTLYGSPKVLFILFALAAFAYLMIFFILSYLYDTDGYQLASEHGSRYTGPSVVEEHEHHHSGFGQALAGGALGAGLASMFQRRQKNRTTSQAYEDSRVSYSDEKYSDEVSQRHEGGWGKRILELGALAGVGMLAKKWWDRRRNREDDTEAGRYRPAHARSDSYTEGSLSRLEDGQPEPSHNTPLNRPPSRPPSRPQSPGSSYYYNSAYSTEPERKPSHGIRDALLGAGAFMGLKKLFGRRKDDDEQSRLDDIRRREEEDERLQRANSKRRQQQQQHEQTAGFYPQRRPSPYTYTESDITPTDVTPRPPRQPSHGESVVTAEPMATGAYLEHSDIPPIPPSHHELSGNLAPPQPPSHHSNHHAEELAAGAAVGAAMGAASSHRRSSTSRPDEHVESPPVSVKVKMHNDGRHVTLRRLTEEEAAAQREARRRERRSSRRRGDSAGSLSGGEGRESDRWRRVEEKEREQAEQIRREQETAAAASAPSASMPPSSYHQSQISQMPPPPPVPPPAPSSMPYGPGSVTSPGTWTGTEASGSYANNRRRRRAERARTRQDRQQQHGVEFE